MSDGASTDAERRPGYWRRGGFWRRAAAWLVDCSVVLIPLQIVVVVLFAWTNGRIQGSFGFVLRTCTPLAALPPGLQTKIPDPTSFVDCRSSLLGAGTSRYLIVSRSETQGATTTGVFETFWLDPSGQLAQLPVYNASWIAVLVLLVYVVGMEGLRGQTLGKRLLGIRTVALSGGRTIGTGIYRALARRLAMMLFVLAALPSWAMAAWIGDDMAAASRLLVDPTYRAASIAGTALSVAWFVWIAVSMVRKRDPIYDRIAGTAVLHASP